MIGAGRGRIGSTGVASILVTGLLVFFLLVFLVVGIDFAYVYYTRGELQNAADSAALAGAALLDGTNSISQMAAREEAWKFACKNRAAHNNVYLVTTGADCDNPPTSGLNESNNDPNGDIVVGYWNATSATFIPATFSGTTPVNALQVHARRWNQAAVSEVAIGNNPVPLIFGKGTIGWPDMSIQRQAIAARKPLATPAISLCVDSCSYAFTFPTDFIIQKDPKTESIPNGMAWTEFDNTYNMPLGPDSTVANLIWGRVNAPDPLCDVPIASNNGKGEVLAPHGDLINAFSSTSYDAEDKQFNPNGSVQQWTVAVPIVQECPPGAQPIVSPVLQIAEIGIQSVNTTGSQQGVTLGFINCVGCPTNLPLGKRVILVK